MYSSHNWVGRGGSNGRRGIMNWLRPKRMNPGESWWNCSELSPICEAASLGARPPERIDAGIGMLRNAASLAVVYVLVTMHPFSRLAGTSTSRYESGLSINRNRDCSRERSRTHATGASPSQSKPVQAKRVRLEYGGASEAAGSSSGNGDSHELASSEEKTRSTTPSQR